jgi:hypothetical protein
VSRWPQGTEDSIGQVGEFLVWANLIAKSAGRLHIFLPALDRGIDAVVHRLAMQDYVAIQVKTKTSVSNTEAPIAVLESHLFTDDQVVIGVHLDGAGLGPYALMANAWTFRRHATRMIDRGRVMLVADMPLRPIVGHRWSEQLVPVDEMAERLGAGVTRSVAGAAGPTPIPMSDEDQVIGSWGENEVGRRMAMLEDCAVFRPFPDFELVEMLVRRLATGATVGLQIKTAQLDEPHGTRHVLINRADFVASPSTFVVALAWIVPERRFHPTCLLVPSVAVPEIAGTSGPYFELHFRPDGSREPSRLDRYRLPLESLAGVVSDLLG